MAEARLTDAELVIRLQLQKQHGPGEAAKLVGVTGGTWRASIRQAKDRGLTPETKVVDETAKLKLKLATLEAAFKHQERINIDAEQVRQEIYGLAARDPEPPEWLSSSGGKPGSRGAPIVLWSDWHRGEVVRAAEVGGVNEFNSEIHDRRVVKLVDTTIDLAFNHMGRAQTKYPGVVICLGGDFINGDIHPELIDTADRTTQQNVEELTDVMGAAIERMATKFGRAFLPCVVGNHGRASLKPRTKSVIHTSHEWNIYCNLARYFRKSKHIRFMIAPDIAAHFTVFGHRYLLTHGDRLGVKGGDGIIGSIGPIMRGSIKVGRAEAKVSRDFDTILMGHWHQYLTLPGIVVNNSLKGFDEFARNVLQAPYSRPSQALWFSHPEHGITAHWQVYLERSRDTDLQAPWVTFPNV